MDLNHLNASQLVLLTLLVSFVTSIATGIVTVSLMEQAPPTIAQTVNRVVERTVERVVPAAQEASAITPIVTEKTVVVKETDYIAAAIEKVSSSVVRLYTTTKDAQGEDADIFLGLGIVTSASGEIYSDAAAWPASGIVLVERPDGSRAPASLIANDHPSGVLVLQGATSSEGSEIAWRPAEFGTATPGLGAAVVSIAGRSTMRVGNGIVSALPSSDEPALSFIDTNVPQGAIVYGSVVTDDRGRVIGISTAASRAQAETAFLAMGSSPMYTGNTQEQSSE